jgi:hypothetical protein
LCLTGKISIAVDVSSASFCSSLYIPFSLRSLSSPPVLPLIRSRAHVFVARHPLHLTFVRSGSPPRPISGVNAPRAHDSLHQHLGGRAPYAPGILFLLSLLATLSPPTLLRPSNHRRPMPRFDGRTKRHDDTFERPCFTNII